MVSPTARSPNTPPTSGTSRSRIADPAMTTVKEMKALATVYVGLLLLTHKRDCGFFLVILNENYPGSRDHFCIAFRCHCPIVIPKGPLDDVADKGASIGL